MKQKAVFINDTSLHENHIGCDCVTDSMIRGLRDNGIETIYRVPLRSSWDTPKVLESIRSADIVIVNGEGCIHSARPWVKDLLQVAEFSNSIRVPCALINTVYQDNDEDTARLVRMFDLVCVRESFSQRELKKEGIDAKVVPDLSFYSLKSYAESMKRANDKKLRRSSSYKLASDSVDKNLALKIGQFSCGEPISNILIHKVPLSPYRRLRYLVSVAIGLRRSYRTYCPLTPKEAFGYIDQAQFFLTGRFHYTCFAIAAGCPFAAIPSNSHKIEGMLFDAGLTSRITSIAAPGKTRDLLNSWNEEDESACAVYTHNAYDRISELFVDLHQLALGVPKV